MTKIAFLARFDAACTDNYAPGETGICTAGHQMYTHLKQLNTDIVPVFPLKRPFSLASSLKKQYYEKFRGQKYHHWSHPSCVNDYATEAEQRLVNVPHDVIFTTENVVPLVKLKTDKPIVAWFDSLLAPQINEYEYLTDLCDYSQKALHRYEKETLPKIDKLIFSNQWAVDEALKRHKIDERKISVLPYGANLDFVLSETEVIKAIEEKSTEVCKLLFLGVDFERKGGQKAFDVAKLLNEQGVKTQITFAGCEPPAEYQQASFVNLEGFIKKHTAEGQQRFNHLLLTHHFLILPTKADCSPLVHMEANAFGLPSLTTEVGGNPTVIHPHKNGLLFDPKAPASAWLEDIKTIWADNQQYTKLSKQALNEYHTRLNWQVSCKKLLTIIEEAVDSARIK